MWRRGGLIFSSWAKLSQYLSQPIHSLNATKSGVSADCMDHLAWRRLLPHIYLSPNQWSEKFLWIGFCVFFAARLDSQGESHQIPSNIGSFASWTPVSVIRSALSTLLFFLFDHIHRKRPAKSVYNCPIVTFVYGIDQAWGQDGWIMSNWVLFPLVYGPRQNTRKKEHSRIQRVIPSGQDWAIIPAWVTNHSAGFGSSCVLTELAI